MTATTTPKTFTPDELTTLLELHRKWILGIEGGERAYLSGANLSGANLSDANLSGANLSGANLSDANLSGANLSGANLSGANLSGANLSGANLSGAYLSGANLSGANLSGAYLSGANLSGANLSDANLSDANLSGAYLSDANLSDATVLSDGVSWNRYVEDLVPALLTAGGHTLEEIAQPRHWECHAWDNCPMAAAFDVTSPSHIPVLYQAHAELFVQLFDSKVMPMHDLTELRKRWELPAIEASAAPACET